MKVFTKIFHHFIDIEEIQQNDVQVIFTVEIIVSKKNQIDGQILSWKMPKWFESKLKYVDNYMQDHNNRINILNQILDTEL